MKISLNYRNRNLRLQEGIQLAGHETRENIWDMNTFISEGIEAAIFDFKYIFKEIGRFFPIACRLKQSGIPVVTWNVDSPWNMGIPAWKVRILLKSRLLSIYATHSLQDTDWVRHTKVIYLPNAAWSSRYNLKNSSLEDLRRPDIYQWDVSFIGNINKERYPEHRGRVVFLEELTDFFLKNKINYIFIDGKDLSVDDQVEIIQKSKINLSCLSAADSIGKRSWGLTERCYGVPACGGFILMEDRVHVKDDFNVGEEVVTYSEIEDCKEKILYYIDRHEDRRMIAERAYQRVIREHTYKHRALKLISEIKMRNSISVI